jgi:hypothetical protein
MPSARSREGNELDAERLGSRGRGSRWLTDRVKRSNFLDDNAIESVRLSFHLQQVTVEGEEVGN